MKRLKDQADDRQAKKRAAFQPPLARPEQPSEEAAPASVAGASVIRQPSLSSAAGKPGSLASLGCRLLAPFKPPSRSAVGSSSGGPRRPAPRPTAPSTPAAASAPEQTTQTGLPQLPAPAAPGGPQPDGSAARPEQLPAAAPTGPELQQQSTAAHRPAAHRLLYGCTPVGNPTTSPAPPSCPPMRLRPGVAIAAAAQALEPPAHRPGEKWAQGATPERTGAAPDQDAPTAAPASLPAARPVAGLGPAEQHGSLRLPPALPHAQHASNAPQHSSRRLLPASWPTRATAGGRGLASILQQQQQQHGSPCASVSSLESQGNEGKGLLASPLNAGVPIAVEPLLLLSPAKRFLDATSSINTASSVNTTSSANAASSSTKPIPLEDSKGMQRSNCGPGKRGLAPKPRASLAQSAAGSKAIDPESGCGPLRHCTASPHAITSLQQAPARCTRALLCPPPMSALKGAASDSRPRAQQAAGVPAAPELAITTAKVAAGVVEPLSLQAAGSPAASEPAGAAALVPAGAAAAAARVACDMQACLLPQVQSPSAACTFDMLEQRGKLQQLLQTDWADLKMVKEEGACTTLSCDLSMQHVATMLRPQQPMPLPVSAHKAEERSGMLQSSRCKAIAQLAAEFQQQQQHSRWHLQQERQQLLFRVWRFKGAGAGAGRLESQVKSSPGLKGCGVIAAERQAAETLAAAPASAAAAVEAELDADAMGIEHHWASQLDSGLSSAYDAQDQEFLKICFEPRLQLAEMLGGTGRPEGRQLQEHATSNSLKDMHLPFEVSGLDFELLVLLCT